MRSALPVCLSVCLIFSSSPVYSCILDIYDMYCFLSSDSRDAKSVKIKNNKATHSTKFKIRCSRVGLRKNQARGYRVHLSMVACCAQSCISVGGMVYCSMRSKIQMGGSAFLCFFWGGVRCRRRVVVCRVLCVPYDNKRRAACRRCITYIHGLLYSLFSLWLLPSYVRVFSSGQ